MELHFRGRVKFPVSTTVVFDCFAPLLSEQKRRSVGTTGFDTVLFVDLEKHRGWVTDIDADEIQAVQGLKLTGFFIDLFTDVNDELGDSVKNATDHPDLRDFGERIAATLELIHDSFIDFARHDAGQYWLPRRHATNERIRDRLMSYETRVSCEDGWRLVDIKEPEPLLITVYSREGITREGWEYFINHIDRGGFRTRYPYRRMLANAYSHLEANDLRAAIIEAVAAWEMVLVSVGPDLLVRSASGYSTQDWRAHIRKAGLTASSALVFAMTKNEKAAIESSEVARAIELRNTVVHLGQQKLDGSTIRTAVSAIDRTILAFEADLGVPRLNTIHKHSSLTIACE